MTATATMISYVAQMQFPARSPFHFGSILVRVRAPDHEVEAAIWEAWESIMPMDFRPSLKGFVPGALVLIDDGDRS